MAVVPGWDRSYLETENSGSKAKAAKGNGGNVELERRLQEGMRLLDCSAAAEEQSTGSSSSTCNGVGGGGGMNKLLMEYWRQRVFDEDKRASVCAHHALSVSHGLIEV